MCDNHPHHAHPATNSVLVETTDRELAGFGTSRRIVLAAGAALLGAAAWGTAQASPAQAKSPGFGSGAKRNDPKLTWLVGDHHVHTQYSHDAKYKITQQLDAARRYGVDWLAFTEHSNFGHANHGGAVNSNREIAAQRASRDDILIFQGIEWYIPAAEHCSVLVAPGPNEVAVLRTFELVWDGKLNGWEKPGSAAEASLWEAKARQAIAWMGEQRRSGYIEDAVILANHPMRLGIDSPHELRGWRDADPEVMIGMEGAPGAQGSGVGTNGGPGDQRGEYTNRPRPDSWPGYREDQYLPYGGFDWVTATVGGVWDSMLAEGKPFFITSNSDNHLTVRDTQRIGDYPQTEPYTSLGSEFEKWSVEGKRPDPVDTGVPQGGSDYWPGQFSRTHTGVTGRGYAEVLEAMRQGRMWVDHGHLLAGLDVRVKPVGFAGPGVTLGARTAVNRGSDLEVSITVTTTDYANAAGIVPNLAFLDIIGGPVTGPVADPDELRAPQTRVLHTFNTTGRRGTFTLRHVFKNVQESFYVRFRGGDGNRTGAGYHGVETDPHGPQPHGNNPGDADPWTDTWFYANPVLVEVR